MANGIISLGTSGNLMGRIVWSSSSNGSAANTSTVTASIQASKTSNTVQATGGTFTGSLNIGGTTKSFSEFVNVSKSGWTTMLSFSITKSHGSDGTGTCYIQGKINGPTGTTLEGKSVSASSTVTLDTIPRKALIKTAPNFNDDGYPTITYSNPAGTSVSSLQACISLTGDSGDDIAYRNIPKAGTSYTFNLTEAERNVLRNATSGNTRTVRFYVKTVIGGETYYDYLERTLTIVNANPTISPTIVDSNAVTKKLTDDPSKLVKYYSNASVVIGAKAIKGATLKSKKVTCGNTSLTADGVFYAVETNKFVFTATDSRGNSTSKTVSNPPTLVNYIKLTCNLGNNTPDAEGNMTVKVTGGYFDNTFGAVHNTLEVFYRYKVQGGEYPDKWTPMGTPAIAHNMYEATAEISGLDYQATYVFQAYAVDKLATVYSTEKIIKSAPVFDWSAEDFAFNVPVAANGGIIPQVLKAGTNIDAVLTPNMYVSLGIEEANYDSAAGFPWIDDGRFDGNGTFTLEVKDCGVAGQVHQCLTACAKNYVLRYERFWYQGTWGDWLCTSDFGGRVLWSGHTDGSVCYPTSADTIALSEPVSRQKNGIVLVFSECILEDGAPMNSAFHSHFIPGAVVRLHSGVGHCIQLSSYKFGYVATKYLYISDTTIKGHDSNTTVDAASGITYTNNRFVLRYVIGV